MAKQMSFDEILIRLKAGKLKAGDALESADGFKVEMIADSKAEISHRNIPLEPKVLVKDDNWHVEEADAEFIQRILAEMGL